jgi:GT2 family glycosyltransferase
MPARLATTNNPGPTAGLPARPRRGLRRGRGGRTIDASVVICAYTEERWSDLVRAVRSVERQDVPVRETIVVVDHNEALLERAIRELTSARVVANTGPRGLSGARNAGVQVARGDVVAFLDDDAHADPAWLRHLLAGFTDASILGVGGLVAAEWDVRRPSWFPLEFDWVVGCSYRGLPVRRSAVRNPIGCNMSFRRSVFELVGGFRSEVGRVGRTPVGCEETELCIRAAARAGGSFVYEPAAIVRHRVPSSRARWTYFRSRCFAEGRSKAVVRRLAGSGSALGSERRYVLTTLPLGVRDAVVESIRTRTAAPLLRAGAIIAGAGVTMAGYVTARPTIAPPSAVATASPPA